MSMKSLQSVVGLALGFTVERGSAGMSTAFMASCGDGSPSIDLLAELDQRPPLGDRDPASRGEGSR